MTTAVKPAKAREKLTLRDSAELLIALEHAVEDHIDEIELNGGALPDWLASMFDEVAAALVDRADAIAVVIDEMQGNESSAKATKDRAARREKVWGNVIASIKAYALRELERLGVDRVKGASATLRIQRNGQPSTGLSAPADNELTLKITPSHQPILLAFADTGGALARFISVQRVAVLDKRALGAAYEARRTDLEAETELLTVSDIPEDVRARPGTEPHPDDVAGPPCLAPDMRRRYIADNLALEFPGVACHRGQHLRVD